MRLDESTPCAVRPRTLLKSRADRYAAGLLASMTNTYHGACLGNWQEEQFSIAADFAEFQRRRANGELLLTKLHAKMAAACAPVPLTPAHADGFLRFGDTVTVHSVLTGTVLAVNMEKQVVGEQIAYQVSGSADPTPVGRTAFTVLRPGGGADAADGGVVHHAQPVVLALRGYKGEPALLLQTQKLALPGLSQSSSSKKDDVCAVTAESKANLWCARGSGQSRASASAVPAARPPERPPLCRPPAAQEVHRGGGGRAAGGRGDARARAHSCRFAARAERPAALHRFRQAAQPLRRRVGRARRAQPRHAPGQHGAAQGVPRGVCA